MSDSYLTIKAFAKDSFIEKRSEFIGNIIPVSNEEAAIAFIKKIKSENTKAKHNVYAYILRDNNTVRYSDDGEPQGTAAVPVLDVLQKEGLTDICCVVTRYFGGILLGGGGLVRAYSHSAKIAVDAAVKLEMHKCVQITISAEYPLYGKISFALNDFKHKISESNFSDTVVLKVVIDKDETKKFAEKLTDVANGKILLSFSDEFYDDL